MTALRTHNVFQTELEVPVACLVFFPFSVKTKANVARLLQLIK